MATAAEMVEKPGGARNVVKWDVHITRQYHPWHTLDGKRFGYGCAGEDLRPTLSIEVTFDDDASAVYFESKIRAMIPEIGRPA